MIDKFYFINILILPVLGSMHEHSLALVASFVFVMMLLFGAGRGLRIVLAPVFFITRTVKNGILWVFGFRKGGVAKGKLVATGSVVAR